MKKVLFLILFLVVSTTFSQKKYAKEFSFITDNDLYISLHQDRYYSNGMFFSYRYLTKNDNEKIEKKSFNFN